MITGITTLFQYGLITGGPGVMVVGWICVSSFTVIVSMAMAEIVSVVPTSGGPYYWAAHLAPHPHAAFASWITGWFNLLGQVAVTTGISFGCAQLISTLATLRYGYTPTALKTVGILAGLLFSHVILNVFGIRFLKYFNNVSIALNSIGVFSVAVAMLAAAPKHAPAQVVFASFYDGTGSPGWSVKSSDAYVAVCGLLLSQYTLTGFDASAHLSEETRNAALNAPRGMITAVVASALFGFLLLLSLLFSIQDFNKTIHSELGQPVVQILLDIFGRDGTTVLMTLITLCIWHCGLFSMTSNSRMMFSFARDSGIPRFFANTTKRTQTPTRAVLLAAGLSFLLAIPSLGSQVAFSAATSIATVGLYLSYGIPILIGTVYRKPMGKGPFSLGSSSWLVACVSSGWICFITIVFCLPQQYPVNSGTFNYTPVAVGVVALWAFGSWFLWARRWFKGPPDLTIPVLEEAPTQSPPLKEFESLW